MRDAAALQACDAQILRALDEGDYHHALATLARCYAQVLRGYCTKLLWGNADAGWEVAQEVLLAVYDQMPYLRRHASLRTWLFAIARRQCLKALHTQTVRAKLTLQHREIIADTVHRAPPVPPEHALFSAEQLRLLEAGREALGDKDRSLLLMYYDTGLTVAEIARILRVSEAGIHKRLQRALARLREAIHHAKS